MPEPLRRQLYVPDADDWERIESAAEAAGVSVSAYVIGAALARAEGELDAEMTPARWRAIAEQVARALV